MPSPVSFALWNLESQSAWQSALDAYPAAIALLPSARLSEHDVWYRAVLPELVAARVPMYVTHDEMVRITEWKMARGVWRAANLVLVRNNPPGAVEDATLRAAELLDTPGPALAAVCELGGVGPATASAALAILAPERFPFFDEIVAGQVEALGPVKWTAGYYRKYAAALVTRAAALGPPWTATMVERALWSHGVHAGARV